MKKYQAIASDLEKAIQNGNYQPNTFLPTEDSLVKHYQVSRDTIRRALRQLSEQGLIKKRHGAGSQVIKQKQINFPVSELTSYQELSHHLDVSSKTNVISIDKLIVDEDLAQLTGFKVNSLIWRIVRQRVVDELASVIDIDYLRKDLIPEMTRQIAEQSIYHYLEEELGLDIAFAQKEITIDQLTDMDKLLLDLGQEHHVVSVKSKVFLSSQEQFQFTESRHKLEKFKFVDFARRKKHKN
ncbi:trehalose operon repressor [Streptococcus sciuri]|uniref:Trehalose operon repressor n=1 Tax=Streptococcus sciuri TaxID=2973939 RepID=A0ABT2F601_9STRE|nr:trehalose operon repressor [Streptococcus sciuri]MCS4487911.1 trehalose operon repressor [Streptococcus sciuri]